MQNTVIILGVALLVTIVFYRIVISRLNKTIKNLKIKIQEGLLCQIQHHTDPQKFKDLYYQYQSNLDYPDWNSFFLKAKESMKRNLKSKNEEEYKRIFKIYTDFIHNIKDVYVRNHLIKAILA